MLPTMAAVSTAAASPTDLAYRLAKIATDQAKHICAEAKKLFVASQFSAAAMLYTEAIAAFGNDNGLGRSLEAEIHRALSNRSSTYCKMKRYFLAECDAKEVVRLAPDWFRGHIRLIDARLARRDISGARAAFTEGEACLRVSQECNATSLERRISEQEATPIEICDRTALPCWDRVRFPESTHVVSGHWGFQRI